MNNTVFRTKSIERIGKILSTTIRPKPLNLSIKLIFCFGFKDFKVIKSFIFRFQKIHITISSRVINQSHEVSLSDFCQFTIHFTKITMYKLQWCQVSYLRSLVRLAWLLSGTHTSHLDFLTMENFRINSIFASRVMHPKLI